MCKKIFNKLTAFLLCLITAVGCSVMVINTPKTAKAENLPEQDYDSDELETFLSNSDVSVDDVESYETYLRDKYIDYIYEDGGCLCYDRLPMFSKYGDFIFNRYECSTEEETYQVTIDMLTAYGVEPDDIDDVFEERRIKDNIDDMNEVVESGEGYIIDGEIVIYDEYFSYNSLVRWKQSEFKWGWYKFSIKLDADWAVVVSLLFLVVNVFWVTDIKNIVEVLQSNEVSEILRKAEENLAGEIFTRVVALFNNDFNDFIASFIPEIGNIVNSSNVIRKIIQLLLKKMIPSLEDCVIVLVNSAYKDKWMYLGFCLLPWKGKYGFTIKSI